MKHFLYQIVLLLFLGSSYITVTHIHHHDSNHHDDCEVCILISNFHSADISLSCIVIPFIEFSYEKVKHYQSFFIRKISKGFNSTAPPFF
ncbi:MAG: hypothetical protein U9O24_00655 [Campylobacterota bacterium]|nr:hypothetical protein [Campylobacterota bacterium]